MRRSCSGSESSLARAASPKLLAKSQAAPLRRNVLRCMADPLGAPSRRANFRARPLAENLSARSPSGLHLGDAKLDPPRAALLLLEVAVMPTGGTGCAVAEHDELCRLEDGLRYSRIPAAG